MMNVPTLAELRGLPPDELVRRHDALVNAKPGGVSDSVNYYLNELARRDNDEATKRMTELTRDMHRFTRDMHRMTIAITVMTLVSVLATLVNLIR